MKQKHTQFALAVALIVLMTGCASSPNRDLESPPKNSHDSAQGTHLVAEPVGDATQEELSQQKIIDALKGIPRSPVELNVDYCKSQRELPPRKLLVAIGETAVFGPTENTNYEMKIRVIKALDEKMRISIAALWGREYLYTIAFITRDGESTPPVILNVDGSEICFIVTALAPLVAKH